MKKFKMKINDILKKLKKETIIFLTFIIIIFSLFFIIGLVFGFFNSIENKNMDNFNNENVQYEEFKNKRMVC
jgi:preprotein translocase subunit SecG